MSDGVRSRTGREQAGRLDLGWDQPVAEKRKGLTGDWKRLVLVIGLGILSWVATYVGMLELIEANVGDLPLLHKVIIGFSVGMLMVMVVWLLDQIFSDIGWTTRLLFVAGYVFLTAISVGFGFGFYWKVLESRGEASRSAESAVGQVQNALHAGVTRLEQLQSTLDSLTQISTEKAAVERQSGTSCPGSRPGDGPRRQLRDEDAGRFKFAADFVRGRVTSIKGELGGLNGDLAKVMTNDRATVDASGTRNEFMRGLNRRLDMTVTGFNAFRSDPQLRQMRTDLAERADRVTFPDSKGGTYQCPDVQLAAALKGVVRAIDELPSLDKPKIAAVEGSEAVIEAFRRLSATMFGALAFKLPPSPEELRDLQKKAVQSVDANGQAQARATAASTAEAGLSKRDYVPLAIALFVDLCLLLVSIKRPASPLERLVPKMRAAEQGPVIQILARFNEIHRDPEIRENFEIFRHVVFDFHGAYYAAVPLNAPYRANLRNGRQAQGYGVAEAEALVQEAHLLTNLFASFEKEKIFSRVMSPLLSTSMIQKRLRRQGSKFANAEAFRLYRFRDGAWSEMILGAVMGAARRVEASERRRRLEEELFGEPRTPADLAATSALDGSLAHRAGASATRTAEPSLATPPRGNRGSFAAVERAPFMPRVVKDETASTGEPVNRPANGNTALPGDRREPSRAAAEHATVPAGENVVLHPAVSRPVPPPLWPSMSEQRPREPDTSAFAPPSAPQSSAFAAGDGYTTGSAALRFDEPLSEAVLHTSPSPEPTVTVEATRETITYTLPVSEARLPASLAARMAGARHEATLVEADPVMLASPARHAPEPRDTKNESTSLSSDNATSEPPRLASSPSEP